MVIIVLLILFLIFMVTGCVMVTTMEPPAVKQIGAKPMPLSVPKIWLKEAYNDYLDAMKELRYTEAKEFLEYQNSNEIRRVAIFAKWTKRSDDTNPLKNAAIKLEELESKMKLPEVEDKEINKLVIKYNNQEKIEDKILVYEEMCQMIDDLNKKNLELWEKSGELKDEENRAKVRESLKGATESLKDGLISTGGFLLGMMAYGAHKDKEKKERRRENFK